MRRHLSLLLVLLAVSVPLTLNASTPPYPQERDTCRKWGFRHAHVGMTLAHAQQVFRPNLWQAGRFDLEVLGLAWWTDGRTTVYFVVTEASSDGRIDEIRVVRERGEGPAFGEQLQWWHEPTTASAASDIEHFRWVDDSCGIQAEAATVGGSEIISIRASRRDARPNPSTDEGKNTDLRSARD